MSKQMKVSFEVFFLWLKANTISEAGKTRLAPSRIEVDVSNEKKKQKTYRLFLKSSRQPLVSHLLAPYWHEQNPLAALMSFVKMAVQGV